MNYDHIISIGGNCDAAHHIRRYYKINTSMPMDWLILPFDAAISLFNERFRDFIRLDKLSLWLGTRHAVQSADRGIVFQHDFSRDASAMVIVDNIVEDFKIAKLKYQRRIDKLNNVCKGGNSILFVRSWREILHSPSDYPSQCIRGVPNYPFQDLIDAIEGCFRDITFDVLFVNYGDQEIDSKRAFFANVENRGDATDWTGSELGWNEILMNYRLNAG